MHGVCCWSFLMAKTIIAPVHSTRLLACFVNRPFRFMRSVLLRSSIPGWGGGSRPREQSCSGGFVSLVNGMTTRG